MSVALGFLEALAGGLLGGLWLVMIGWFLREAGQAEIARSRVSPIVEKLTVAEAMSADPVAVNGRPRSRYGPLRSSASGSSSRPTQRAA